MINQHHRIIVDVAAAMLHIVQTTKYNAIKQYELICVDGTSIRFKRTEKFQVPQY